jgi:large subunit ribosomal protein L30
MGNKVKITLKKSVIGRPADQRQTVRGLGLSRISQMKELDDTPEIRGMIRKVAHLLTVED